MQLLAACQKARDLKRLVVKSSAAVYGSSPRDPAMFTEDMGAQVACPGRVRQGLGRGRGLRPRVLPAPPRRGHHHAAPGQRHRPGHPHHDDRLLLLPRRSRCRSGYDARMQFVHEDDAIGALVAAPPPAEAAGIVNVAGDGMLTVCPGRRDRRAPGAADAACRRPGVVGGVVRQLGPGRLLRRPDGVPRLRPWPGHHPDARGARLRAAFTTRAGLRGLRPHLSARSPAPGRPAGAARRAAASPAASTATVGGHAGRHGRQPTDGDAPARQQAAAGRPHLERPATRRPLATAAGTSAPGPGGREDDHRRSRGATSRKAAAPAGRPGQRGSPRSGERARRRADATVPSGRPAGRHARRRARRASSRRTRPAVQPTSTPRRPARRASTARRPSRSASTPAARGHADRGRAAGPRASGSRSAARGSCTDPTWPDGSQAPAAPRRPAPAGAGPPRPGCSETAVRRPTGSASATSQPTRPHRTRCQVRSHPARTCRRRWRISRRGWRTCSSRHRGAAHRPRRDRGHTARTSSGASPQAAGLPAPPADRRLRDRRLRLRRRLHRPRLAAAAAPALPALVPGRGARHREHPGDGARLVVANHSGTLPLDALMTQVAIHDEHPQHRPRADAGRRPGLLDAVHRQIARKSGSTLAANPDAERLLRPAASSSASSPRASRASASRSASATSCSASAAAGSSSAALPRRGADHPVLDRRAPRRSSRWSAT